MDALSNLAWDFDHFMKSAPLLPITLIWLAVAAIPVTLLHEWGHALAARRLLGGEVKVSVGNAGRVAEIRLGQIATSINACSSPTRFAGQATFDGSHATARDVVRIALAGPLASLFRFLAVLPLYSATAPGTVAHGFLWALVFESAFGVLLNLIPFTIQNGRGSPKRRSDGGLAFDALKVIGQLR
jgi:hypothetical protein